jgi:hypothetical protein
MKPAELMAALRHNRRRSLSGGLVAGARHGSVQGSGIPRGLKPAPLLLMLAAAVTLGADAPPMPSADVAKAEKIINQQFAALYPDEPYFLLGLTRSIYLDDFGLIFSTEINLAPGPAPSPFQIAITEQQRKNYRDKKMSRLPKLKNEMYSILGNATMALHPPPQAGNVVLGVTLFRYAWEDASGIPSQIVMQAQWSKLLEARKKGAPLDSVVRVREY